MAFTVWATPEDNTAFSLVFDAVARQCAAAGYRVFRIPVVPGVDGRTFVTYVNAILDERDGRRIVYMPVFRCAEVLNAAAAAVWFPAPQPKAFVTSRRKPAGNTS